MSFTVLTMPQRSPEWAAARLGRVTGSVAADMLATVKSGGEAAGRRNLRARLVLERLTNRSHERGFGSGAMQDGIEREPDARAAYEALTGQIVREVGFVSHDELMAGGSPDAVIGEWEGLAEIKSPIAATHLDYLRTGQVPGKYAKQVTHLLWLTGAAWCDWLSFQPDFPEPLQIKLVRVHRDEKEIAAYELALRLFLSEVDREVAAVQALAVGAA